MKINSGNDLQYFQSDPLENKGVEVDPSMNLDPWEITTILVMGL